MAKANKLTNEKRMKDLGLDIFKPSPLAKAKLTAPRTFIAPRKIDLEPTRRSKRIRKEDAPEITDLPSDRHSDPLRLQKTHKIRPVTPESLTEQDRQRIAQRYRGEMAWLQDMETYLAEHERVSHRNLRTVMRQVGKLCTGAGVTYHHWPDGVVFAPHEKVDLSWDLEELFVRACTFEDEHGRDLGNGWLLRLPIRKMIHFQHFLSGNKRDDDDPSE